MVFTVALTLACWAVPMVFIHQMQKEISNRKLAIALAVATGTAISLFFTTVLLLILLLY